jgi:formylmethanofuran dehydrogenase subunit E
MPNEHIHKYKRVKLGTKQEYWVMQCQDSQCAHYFPMSSKLSAPRLIGKMSRCNKCDEPFLMDRRSNRQAFPTCLGCVDSPNKVKLKGAEDFFQDLEKKLIGGG